MIEQQSTVRPSDNETINLIDYVLILLRRRSIIMATVTTITVLTGLLLALSPNIYTSQATLLPVEKNTNSNLSSLLGTMSGGLGLLAAQAGLSNSGEEKFVTLLNTRTLYEAVISKQNLMPVLFEGKWDEAHKAWKKPWLPWSKEKPSMQDAVRELRHIVNVGLDKKTNVISIGVSHKDPNISARVANAFVNELQLYLQANALSTAKRNRIFVEGQLRNTQTEMANFEVALKDFQQTNKVVSLDAQAEASVKAYSDLKAKLLAAEVELSLIEKSTFDTDPRGSLKRQEITELKKQLAKFENGSESGPIVSFHRAPSLGLSYARLKRELLIREKVFELLTQQFEMAKIQEAQEDISFVVLDSAIPPEKKSGPKRAINLALAIVSSLLLGVVLAIVAEIWDKHKTEIQGQLRKSS